jgi:putative ABC transport system ATP-binding protein
MAPSSLAPGSDSLSATVVRARQLVKAFGAVPHRRALFEALSFDLIRGQTIALVGESGCGKSTLLNVLAGLEPLDSGDIELAGQPLRCADTGQAARLRRAHLGFVFQAFHLLPQLDVVHNVMLPLLMQAVAPDQARARALAMLAEVGLKNRANDAVGPLSGGEQQRVAVARALVHEPSVVLADEPTGNLDERNAQEVLELLVDTAKTRGACLLMVTHSELAAAQCAHQWRLHRGQLTVLR